MPTGATGVDTNTLTLVALKSQDAGSYRCVASNEVNSSTTTKYATIAITGLLSLYQLVVKRIIFNYSRTQYYCSSSKCDG